MFLPTSQLIWRLKEQEQSLWEFKNRGNRCFLHLLSTEQEKVFHEFKRNGNMGSLSFKIAGAEASRVYMSGIKTSFTSSLISSLLGYLVHIAASHPAGVIFPLPRPVVNRSVGSALRVLEGLNCVRSKDK